MLFAYYGSLVDDFGRPGGTLGSTLMFLGSTWDDFGGPWELLARILELLGLIFGTLGIPASPKVVQDGIGLTS